MSQYLIRFDRGGPDERFDAVTDAAARDYARDLLLDLGAEEGDGGSLYRLDDGGRGDEEYIGEVHLGDDEPEPGECFIACDWRDGAP
jgi:hypothetical protein